MLNEIENVNNLSNEDLFNLIFNIIDINGFSSTKEADGFINLLTNHPTPVREAVAYKLEEVISANFQYFSNELFKEKFVSAIADINPNISRIMCDIILNNSDISGMVIADIIQKINSIIAEIKVYEVKTSDFFQNKVKNKKNHAKNKLLFSLYWYMEALSGCNIVKHRDEILKILNYTITFCDYTIREKTAKLLTKIDNPPFEILQKAKSDENFYVKIQVYDKIKFEDLN